MKKSPLPTVLLGLLALSAVASVFLCWMYIGAAREIRALNTEGSRITGRRTALNALSADLLEYSKHNPQIDPLLESVGMKQKSSSATATNKTATK